MPSLFIFKLFNCLNFFHVTTCIPCPIFEKQKGVRVDFFILITKVHLMGMLELLNRMTDFHETCHVLHALPGDYCAAAVCMSIDVF